MLESLEKKYAKIKLAMDNMTMKEYRAYRLQAREAIDRKIDELGGVVKAREAGSFGYGGCKHASALDINCNSNYRQRLISSVLWLK